MEQTPQNTADDGQPSEVATAMRRKARTGTATHQARAMSLAKALRLSLAKVADELCDMAMVVIGVRRQQCKGEALGDLMADGKLLILLDGPLQQRGAAIIDPVVVGGLIQQQTMGKVQPVLSGDVRAPTATDAAICAPILDAWLARAATLPEAAEDRQLIEGYAFGARCEEPRLLMLALEEPEYEVLHLTVDLAGGARQGEVIFCFPEATGILAEIEAASQKGEGRGDQPKAPPAMERVVMGLAIDLNIAISRLKLPLRAVQSLEVGQVLDLNVSSFDHASVQTPQGRVLSKGTLGQLDGWRALQLEHKATLMDAPMRRATDRETLELPRVSGDGTGTRMKQVGTDIKQLPPMDTSLSDMPDLPDLPEGLDLPDLPELGDAAALADLPDMSDLPGFGAGDTLPDLDK